MNVRHNPIIDVSSPYRKSAAYEKSVLILTELKTALNIVRTQFQIYHFHLKLIIGVEILSQKVQHSLLSFLGSESFHLMLPLVGPL